MIILLAYHINFHDVESPVELAASTPQVDITSASLPVLFVENGGWLPKDVLYASTNGLLRVLWDGSIAIGEVTITPGSKTPVVLPNGKPQSRFSYFGRGRAITNVSAVRSLRFRGIEDGIDFILNGLRDGRLEYSLYLHEGANPDKIRISVSGGELSVRDTLVIVRRGKDEILRIGLPRAYQGTKELPVRFVRKGEADFGFAVEGYDATYPLLIDPTAIIASPLEDKISHIYIDRSGNVFVTGWTLDYYNFIGGTSFGNPDIGVRSAFVVKLTPDLSSIVSSAIIAGSDHDYGWAVGVDANGYVYVGGSTRSSDFAPSRIIYGATTTGKYQWFVTKLSPDLSTHIKTVIISGADHDLFRDLEISDNGEIYLTGYTYDYSTFAPSRNTMGSCSPPDAAVVKLDTSLSYFGEATVVCGDISDGALGITVTRDAVFLSGATNSPSYAPSRTVYGPTGNWNAFVTKLSRDLRTHIASAIITSFQYDVAYETVVDNSGYVNVVGFTYDGNSFSTSRDILGTVGTYDVFITRLSSDLGTHIRTLIVASPDTDLVYVKTSAHQGDTMFVLINTQDPSGLASSCSSCDLAGGGGPWDAVVVGVSMDLTSCVGRSIFTASGDEGAYALAVRDANVYAAGPLTSYTLSEYPDPQYEYGFTGDIDSYVILGRPQCLVGVSEAPANNSAQDVVITSEGITFTIRYPAYVGYDVVTVDGRILQRRALGYLLPGRYSYPISLQTPGAYVIRLKIGEHIKSEKLIYPAK